MFNNRVFNIAFLISLTWHFTCMATVNIVVLPGKYKIRDMSSVSFLGPILEKTALDIIMANKPVAVTTSYQRDLRYMHSVGRKDELRLEENSNRPMTIQGDDIGKALSRLPRKDKKVLDFARRTAVSDIYTVEPEKVSGNILERELIYRPEKPKLPSWIEGNAFNLELEFFISAQGEVREVIPVAASGSTEVDLIGIRYLKAWRFAPLSKAKGGEEKGRIKFIFEKE